MSEHQFVEHLPDLIQPTEYPTDPDGRRVRLRLQLTDNGVELLGDAMRPQELQSLFQQLDAKIIEQMLCG